MSDPVAGLLAAVLAYLIGSIPFGFLTARWVAGIDIRQQGSGNIGATNVGRVVGKKWGILVLLLDCFKGLLPTLLLPMLLVAEGSPNFLHIRVLTGICTVIGHMYPCYLKLRGGKGVATTLGVILILGWQASLIAFAGFAVTYFCSRIVSLSSIVAALAFLVTQIALLWPNPFSQEQWSLGVFSLLIPGLIVYRHRSNIVRLFQGTEPKFSTPAKSIPDASTESETGPIEKTPDVSETESENSPES